LRKIEKNCCFVELIQVFESKVLEITRMYLIIYESGAGFRLEQKFKTNYQLNFLFRKREHLSKDINLQVASQSLIERQL